MYHNAFEIERSVRQGYPLSPLLYVLGLEPLLRRLRDEGKNPALQSVPFADPLTASVSAFADDITVFVSRCLNIKAVTKAVGEYEWIAGAKVNFDKSKGLRLGALRGSLGGNLAFKEVVLKGLGRGVRRMRLPPDSLPIGCTSSA